MGGSVGLHRPQTISGTKRFLVTNKIVTDNVWLSWTGTGVTAVCTCFVKDPEPRIESMKASTDICLPKGLLFRF